MTDDDEIKTLKERLKNLQNLVKRKEKENANLNKEYKYWEGQARELKDELETTERSLRTYWMPTAKNEERLKLLAEDDVKRFKGFLKDNKICFLCGKPMAEEELKNKKDTAHETCEKKRTVGTFTKG